MAGENSKVCVCDVLFKWSLAAVLTVVAGCSSDEAKKDEATPTQVAVRVNGQDITIHQINRMLTNREITPENADATRRKVLDRLIDRELAVQQAVAGKLDRQPHVMQSIEETRNDVLARAFLEKVAGGVPKLQSWDVKDRREITRYYNEHPELFAERRIFTLEEIVVVEQGENSAGLQQLVTRAHNMGDIAAWLTARDIKFSAGQVVRGAEGIRLQDLPRVQTMRPGEIAFFELDGGRKQVLRVVRYESAPIGEEDAAPRIAQYLLNVRSTEAMTTEIRRLRQSAKIEYMGEFADVDNVEGAVEQGAVPGGATE